MLGGRERKIIMWSTSCLYTHIHSFVTCYRTPIIILHTHTHTHTHSLLHHVVVDEAGHDRDGDGAWTVSKHLRHLLVLKTNHVLAIHLRDVMVYQNTIAAGEEKQRSHDFSMTHMTIT